MIDKAKLKGQIANLEQQQAAAKMTFEQAEGALRLCRFWLAELENAPPAAANGVAETEPQITER